MSILNTALALVLLCSMLISLAAGILAGPSVAQAQTNTGLALWLKFDEGTGATTFVDAAGSNAAGTCAGTTCPTPA